MNDVVETPLQETTREKLLVDVRRVISDSEEILRATAGQAGDKIADLRTRAQANLATAKVKLAEAEVILVDKTKAVARATDDYVHDNPWQAVGVAAGVGLVIGLLIGRR